MVVHTSLYISTFVYGANRNYLDSGVNCHQSIHCCLFAVQSSSIFHIAKHKECCDWCHHNFSIIQYFCYFETTMEKIEINGTFVFNLQRTSFGNMRIYGILYFDSLYVIFTFALPLILLLFLNTKLKMVYKQVQARRNT